MPNKSNNLCGIDEAGRGPLAGPLVVAGVILKDDIVGLNDSKKLSQKKREELFPKIIQNSFYHIVFKSASQIDEKGLTLCLKESILEIIQNLKPHTNNFLVDGNSSFGIQNLQKEIKADALYPQVSAASILAKVSRDNYMQDISKEFPNYEFHQHKGYGTKLHIEKIEQFGYCKLHRSSFKLKLTKN